MATKHKTAKYGLKSHTCRGAKNYVTNSKAKLGFTLKAKYIGYIFFQLYFITPYVLSVLCVPLFLKIITADLSLFLAFTQN